MSEPIAENQYMVMYSKMGMNGIEMVPVNAHYSSLEEATAVAQEYAQWHILEISVKIVKTNKDVK